MKIQNILKDKEVEKYLLNCFDVRFLFKIKPQNPKTKDQTVNLLTAVCRFLKYFVLDNVQNKLILLEKI